MNLSLFALRRAAVLTLTLMLALVVAACSSNGGDNGNGNDNAASEPAAGEGGTATVSNGTVDVSADDMKFDVSTIEAPAGETWTITFTNNDTAPHNIAIYTEEGGDEIVKGDVINQGETVEVEVPALDAGSYYFHCDIHPDMNGTVEVG